MPMKICIHDKYVNVNIDLRCTCITGRTNVKVKVSQIIYALKIEAKKKRSKFFVDRSF